MIQENEVDIAYKVALKEINDCNGKHGLLAGLRHYKDYWTRDAGLAFLSLSALRKYSVMKRHLETLSVYQKKNGLIPYILRENFPLLQFLGVKLPLKNLMPQYKNAKAFFTTDVADSNAYYIIGWMNLVSAQYNAKLFNRHIKSIELALGWYAKRIDPADGLVKVGIISEWNDGVYKKGKTLMTNVLVYKSFLEYLAVCGKYKKTPEKSFIPVARRIKEALDSRFFNGNYFIDWIDLKKHDFFDSNANFLSIILGVSSRAQSVKILKFASENAYFTPMMRVSVPDYPWWRLEFFNTLFGLRGYSGNGNIYWCEPALLFSLALAKVGRTDEAKQALFAFSRLVNKHGGIYELYSVNKDVLVPYSGMQYSSEHPFARGAGLFILAYHYIFPS